MAADLLSTIHAEIAERLDRLRPLLAEHEQLLVAAEALDVTGAVGAQADVATNVAKSPRARRAKSAVSAALNDPAGAPKRRAAKSTPRTEKKAPARRRAASQPKPARAVRGAAREAILGALEHGSHTVGELSVVTAMTGPNINGNLRRLAAEGVVVKTEREGKAAWALSGPVV